MTISASASNPSKIFPIESNQKSLLLRRYPPVGQFDTIEIIRNAQGNPIGARSAHGTCSIFNDKEILQVHFVIRREFFEKRMNDHGKEEEVYVDFTQNNKAIIQQQATRGCTAATAAMLIKDQGGKPNFPTLQERNLGNEEDIKQDIRSAGFNPIIISLASNSLEALRKQLLKSGSAIVSLMDPQVRGHSIVIDEVSEDLSQIRLRDPYHGWEITVSAEAFQSRWTSLDCKIIQIGNEVSISKKDHSCKKALKSRGNFFEEKAKRSF